jgi:hypothetical protein
MQPISAPKSECCPGMTQCKEKPTFVCRPPQTYVIFYRNVKQHEVITATFLELTREGYDRNVTWRKTTKIQVDRSSFSLTIWTAIGPTFSNQDVY